jgi:hypothetical protein
MIICTSSPHHSDGRDDVLESLKITMYIHPRHIARAGLRCGRENLSFSVGGGYLPPFRGSSLHSYLMKIHARHSIASSLYSSPPRLDGRTPTKESYATHGLRWSRHNPPPPPFLPPTPPRISPRTRKTTRSPPHPLPLSSAHVDASSSLMIISI